MKHKVEAGHVFGTFSRMVRLGMSRWLLCLTGVSLIGLANYTLNLLIGLVLSSSLEHIEAGMSPVATLLLVLLGLFAAMAVMTGGYITNLSGAMGIRARIQRRLVAAWLRQTERFATKQHSGDAMSIVTSDMDIVEDFYFQGLMNVFFIPFLQGLAAVVTVIAIDWRLVLPPIIAGLISLFVSIRFSGRVQTGTRAARSAMDRVTRSFSELCGGNITHRMLGTRQRALDSYAEESDACAKKESSAENIKTNVTFFGKLLDVLSMACFLGIAIWISSSGQLAFPLVMLAMPMHSLISEMMMCFGASWNFLVTATASGERVLGALSWPQENRDSGKAALEDTIKDETVAFRDVHFGYEQDKPVLRGISFQLEKGQTVALVGASGGGKSTIFQLLLRFFAPDEGVISIGGTETEDCTLDSWRACFVYLQQDAPLLAKSVKENIAMGLYGSGRIPTDTEIETAARAAGAHGFITELPDGYDTQVAEHGGNLSGGQRQRIAIARAFLSDAPILLLDEPTAALDAESERLVQQSLDSLMREKTVLVAAHRLDTVKNADEILVLDSGHVAEHGTHEQLLASKGIYAGLYNTQLMAAKEQPISV